MKGMVGILLAAMLTAGIAIAAPAQSCQDRDERQAYREGYRLGIWDARHGRRADWDDNRWRESDDRAAYRNGYTSGYREVRAAAYRNRYTSGYREVRADFDYDRYPSKAHRVGYQDGFNDGVRDYRTGHSFRPAHSDHFEDADHGYDLSLGSKSYYQQNYRNAYRQGYERGYSRR